MRAGVSTVQQTLTAEAATILKQAVTEACKRGHAQATPLHVAATLLLSPSSPLRRACLQTHSHSSHLPHCRALELCFNIALERLQAAPGPLPNGQPSYSNALLAALKRAQAHQRRGCPEQQQQPLLAVKVELEQLIISILDDPSVSRVMREAGFSSTDVKSHLEETVSLMASHHSVTHSITDPVRLPLSVNVMDQMGFRLGGAPSILGGFPLPHHLTPFGNGTISQDRNEMQLHIRPLRTPSPYMNPILLKPGGMPSIVSGGEDTKQVLEVLMRKKKRNPVLLGDSAARVDGILRDVIQHLERRNVPEQLRGIKVVPANLSFMTLMNASKEDLYMRFMELNKSVQELVLTGGVVVDVGNLQWLLQMRATASRMAGFCPVQHAAHEIKMLFDRHQDSNRMWLIGTATNQTFRNCQALYQGLESQWELQPVPIGATGPANLPARCSTQETGTSGTDSLTLSLLPSAASSLHLSITGDEDAEQLTCCLDCSSKYEKEALLLRDQEGSKQPDSPQSCSSSVETPSKALSDQGLHSTCVSQPVLPLWLQQALPNGSTNAAASVAASAEAKGKAFPLATKLQELQKKWNQTCKSLHPERPPRLNASLEMWRQPSPPSSHVSGNPSGRCQDGALSLLRENLTGPGTTRPMVGTHPTLNGHHTSRAVASSLAISNMQNGISSDQLLQLTAHRDRVQEDTNGCSASNIRLPWQQAPSQQAPSAATPMMRNTEADAPCSASDNAIRGKPSRMFLHMNPEALGQLCKGLAKKVGWQPKIISTIAERVMQCRSGLGKRVGASSKGDTWLLFLGHDRTGKRIMAEALAELIFGADKKPICLTLGKQQDVSSPATWSLGLTVPTRGKMPLDQLADAVRLHPSSLFYLEDVEQADSMFRSSLLRAMSKGRLVDSSGRDVSLSSVIVVMTSTAGTEWSAATCTGSETQLGKDRISEGVARLNSGNEDSACTAGNGRMETSQQQWLLSKRKGGWNADDEPQEKELSSLNKKPNLGRGALDLDLNMAAEENDKCGFSISHAPARDVRGTMRPELSEEEVLVGARKRLGELCDLVDAAVVFASPL